MNDRTRLCGNLIAAGLVIGLAGAWLTSAKSANVVVTPSADFSAAPFTISLGSRIDLATYTFSVIPENDGVTIDQVSTGGRRPGEFVCFDASSLSGRHTHWRR
jgi:hypothetical protein